MRMALIGIGLVIMAVGSLFCIEQGRMEETSPALSAGLKTINGVGMLLYFLRLLYHWAPDGSGYLGPDNTFTVFKPGKRPKLPHEEYEEGLARQAELTELQTASSGQPDFDLDPELNSHQIAPAANNKRVWVAVAFLASLVLGVLIAIAVASSPESDNVDVVDVLQVATFIPVIVVLALLQRHLSRNRLPHLTYAAEQSRAKRKNASMRLQAQRHVDALIGKRQGDSSNTLELEPTGR